MARVRPRWWTGVARALAAVQCARGRRAASFRARSRTSPGVWLAVVVFIGFDRTYYLAAIFGAKPPGADVVHMHGAVFTCWMALLVAQTPAWARAIRDFIADSGCSASFSRRS